MRCPVASRPRRAFTLDHLTIIAIGIAMSVSCGSIDPVAPSESPVPVTLVGAGDIADCGSPGASVTAGLLDSIPGTVFTAGDNAYPNGTAQQFRDCYGPTWGRHRSRTHPAPGNHDYEQSGGAPYFEYFGQNAGPSGLGYYRFALGAWEVYSLNSNLGLDAHSAQLQWLRRELTGSASQCTVVIWHHPLFSSGPNGISDIAQPLWRMLQEFAIDIVINGHEHLYERFAPQDADGRADPVRGSANTVRSVSFDRSRIGNSTRSKALSLSHARMRWRADPAGR